MNGAVVCMVVCECVSHGIVELNAPCASPSICAPIPILPSLSSSIAYL